jgi:hypothetical protein
LIEFFNDYSAFITIPGIIVLLIAMLPIKGKRKQIPVYVVAAIVAIRAVFILRPGSSTVASEVEAHKIIASDSRVVRRVLLKLVYGLPSITANRQKSRR